MLMAGYKYYAVDWDGTLMDTQSLYYNALLEARSLWPEPIALPEDFLSLFGDPCDVACVKLGVSDPTAFRDLWLNSFLQACLKAEPYPEVAEVLKQLQQQGARIYLASNRNRFTAYPMMNLPAFKGVFSGSVCFEDAEPKPSGAPLLYLRDTYGVELNNCLMIGDSVHDRMCALHAGVDFLSPGWNKKALRGEGIYAPQSPFALLED